LRQIKGIEYMNSGDWVESNTALVENFEGKWEIINY
jgi:UDP-2,3-diacylglucosamine pyrophosphatase LpxH